MTTDNHLIFLSYSGDNSFEASLLQYALESLLNDLNIQVWTYERDQRKDQKRIAQSLKARVRESIATVFLVSPSTIDTGAAQWMELAYSDAFDVPTFVLLHQLSFQDLKNKEKGVPPLLLESQCNRAIDWKEIVSALRSRIEQSSSRIT